MSMIIFCENFFSMTSFQLISLSFVKDTLVLKRQDIHTRRLSFRVTFPWKPRQKDMAQMKEYIKAPEKIQLSNEEIANLSDAQFKTLVIRMLIELVEYGCKIEEKNEGYEKWIEEIEENL